MGTADDDVGAGGDRVASDTLQFFGGLVNRDVDQSSSVVLDQKHPGLTPGGYDGPKRDVETWGRSGEGELHGDKVTGPKEPLRPPHGDTVHV